MTKSFCRRIRTSSTDCIASILTSCLRNARALCHRWMMSYIPRAPDEDQSTYLAIVGLGSSLVGQRVLG